MTKALLGIVACVLFGAPNLSAQQEQTFKGTCLRTDATYVLSNPVSKAVYKLDDQTKPRAFARQSVVVIGTLNKATGTIHVSDMIRALPQKVTLAKFVYVDCDACPRGMAAAKKAAIQGLMDWRRFTVLRDRHSADLIFLFSANPYLGDYVTRKAPDTRLVSVEVTFMSVINPDTGESLWGDCRKWGSWNVDDATKDLISEFRMHVEANEGRAGKASFADEGQDCRVSAFAGK
jgi:hypothetical protein